jgi:hypothetical protein
MIKAAVMEASVEAGGAVGDVPERDELLSLLGEAARGGSVTAMKVLLDERRRDGDDDSEKKPAVSVIDQLAERRAAGG